MTLDDARQRLRSHLHTERVRMRQLQDSMPLHIVGKRYSVTVEGQSNSSAKISWKRFLEDEERLYSVKLWKITGLVDPDNFQGYETLNEVSLTGSGMFVDQNIVGGMPYMYEIEFSGDSPEETVGHMMPFMLPMSSEITQRFEQFLVSTSEPVTDKARREFEEFQELEETADEMEKAALDKLAKKYSGDELRRRIARTQAFFSQLRQKRK